MALKRGDKAPEILGVDQTGKEIRLSDFAGSKLILYFYPKDNTPGCTAEACRWREKKMAGRTYMGTVRTTFIIDENGVITDIIEKVDTKNHASQILKNK